MQNQRKNTTFVR